MQILHKVKPVMWDDYGCYKKQPGSTKEDGYPVCKKLGYKCLKKETSSHDNKLNLHLTGGTKFLWFLWNICLSIFVVFMEVVTGVSSEVSRHVRLCRITWL